MKLLDVGYGIYQMLHVRNTWWWCT